MTAYTYSCPQCSGEAVVNFGDRVLNTRLIWSASHQCHQCQYAVEEDGLGRLPDPLRDFLLDQEGVWAVRLQSSIRSSAITLKVLRQAFDLTLSEVKNLLQQPSDLLPVGTRSEAALVLLLLGDNGIGCEIEQFEQLNLDLQSE